TFGGPITATGNATISAPGGTLTLTGGINKIGVNLTLGSTNAANAGGTIIVNTVGISGNNGSFNSDLIVDSATVSLNAANTYVGNTFIRTTAAAGTLNANVQNALPNSTDPNINL